MSDNLYDIEYNGIIYNTEVEDGWESYDNHGYTLDVGATTSVIEPKNDFEETLRFELNGSEDTLAGDIEEVELTGVFNVKASGSQVREDSEEKDMPGFEGTKDALDAISINEAITNTEYLDTALGKNVKDILRSVGVRGITQTPDTVFELIDGEVIGNGLQLLGFEIDVEAVEKALLTLHRAAGKMEDEQFGDYVIKVLTNKKLYDTGRSIHNYNDRF